MRSIGRKLMQHRSIQKTSSRRAFSTIHETIEYVDWDEAGHRLLENPVYNKGQAFTKSERKELGLIGLIPPVVETIEEQLARAYESYRVKPSDLEKHIYLRQLQDTNEVLFYALTQKHISEMLPIIYTPTVGLACQRFSQIYRRARGVFISYPQRHMMRQVFQDLVARGWTGGPTDVDTSLDIRVIVVTDGSRILGLGDLGANGMGIPIGKCALYTAIGGIPGAQTLPMFLDVGTNNEECLKDPNYIGWRHERLTGDVYYQFVDEYVQLVKEFFPNTLLQWEDFNIDNAGPLLNKYKDQLCSFNDDIQGTATVTVGTLLAACKQVGKELKNCRVAMVGAGSAGCGIANMIRSAMVHQGLSEEEATQRFYMVDRYGLLHEGYPDMRPFQKPFAQKLSNLDGWGGKGDVSWDLAQVTKHAKPDILIGVSGVPNLFTQEAIENMAAGVERPIIFPLSNPTSRVEGTPVNMMKWTDYKSVVATGTAFPPTEWVISETATTRTIKRVVHSQCNNSYIFPGVGLGVLVSGAKRVTDKMLMAASFALATKSPAASGEVDVPLLPPLEEIVPVSEKVAVEVAAQAIRDGVATNPDVTLENLEELVSQAFWHPKYKTIKLYEQF